MAAAVALGRPVERRAGVGPGSEIPIGLDARAAGLDANEHWDAARRATYLLRTDVERPLSVDRVVWPAVAIPGPNPYRLWTDADELRRNVEDPPGRSRLVAFTVVTQGLTEQELAPQTALLSISGVVAPAVPSGSLLGYDVADLGLLSGLTNSGYAHDSVEAMRATWAPRLNPHHLFADRADAARFKSTTDVRVPEHAPFYVYGIYRVT